MKKIFFLITILIITVTSCYFTTTKECTDSLTFIDMGVYYDDADMHIVSIEAPVGYDIISYTTDGTTPVMNSVQYSPGRYRCADNKFYYGILVRKGVTVKAVGYKKESSTYARTIIGEFSF